uniref:Uncharacterized protein n=1 Tax=Knipowitschia caucasica TaxID=637954 RepID=A0AAV2K2G1_KNICA
MCCPVWLSTVVVYQNECQVSQCPHTLSPESITLLYPLTDKAIPPARAPKSRHQVRTPNLTHISSSTATWSSGKAEEAQNQTEAILQPPKPQPPLCITALLSSSRVQCAHPDCPGPDGHKVHVACLLLDAGCGLALSLVPSLGAQVAGGMGLVCEG